ncbi:hypothetical protein SOVF_170860 [Spinacia oleracea]|nr:hypothetical protein SOVF_170860 [Spinacia oleracea]
MEISNQVSLVKLDVSSNKFSGEIPDVFNNLPTLQKLYMAHNFFHGLIPQSFASLKSLLEVDLSHNRLSGPVPRYLSSFPLIYLNLSYNNFEGEVPTKGIFANASAISLVGNNRLCGGISELHLARCVKKAPKKTRMYYTLKLVIFIISTIIGILATGSCIWLFLTRHYKKREPVSLDAIGKESFSKVSYHMLLKATNGFSMGNLLGSGTFGSVFQGNLDGKTVAVKVLNLQQRGGNKSFMAECEAMRNIRHRNLVGIITAQLAQVWISKEKISKLLSHALNYLHHECGNSIVHCDLKPNNILLHHDMVARVSDFGLAKVLARPLHPNQSSSVAVRGTIGYVAPEYGLGAEASPKADIYSYGILLLELMTSKRPTDNMFMEENLHMYSKDALHDRVLKIVDSTLLEHENEEVESSEIKTQVVLQNREECITLVVKIGVACSNQLPRDRMKISDVIIELQEARKILLISKQRQTFSTITQM